MPKANEIKFDPQKSVDNDAVLANFIRAEVSGNLDEVPGVGPANIKNLAKGADSVKNTFQLIAKFLSFSPGKTGSCVKHCDDFYDWLASKGINGGRNDIIKSIAEKVNCAYPGIYREEEWR